MRGGAAAGGTAPAPDLRRAPLRSPRRAGAAALAALGIAALLAAFLLTSPYVLLDFGSFWRDLSAEREHMASGHFGLAGGAAAFTYARDWFTSVMGAPLGVASLAGLAWFAWRRRAWALLGAGFLVPYLAIVGSWQMKADRYLLPLIPIAIVAAAALAEAMADAAGRRSPRLAPAVAAAAALILGAPLAARLPAHWATLRPDTRTQARRWIEDHLPRGSLVASEAYGPDVFSPLDLQALDPDLGNELLRRGLIRRLYGLLQVPMYQVQPERSAKYYVMPVWSAADVFITTDAVGSRYRREPGRFAPQLAFYDSLAARWPRLATFVPRRQPGPTITIYRNPAVKAPFAERTPPTGPDSTIGLLAHPVGEEGLFFYELGVNHEAFGQVHEARECFLLALRFGATEPDIYVNAGARLVGSIWEEGRHDAALALLDRLAARAPGPLQVAQLGGLRARLLAGAMSGGARP